MTTRALLPLLLVAMLASCREEAKDRVVIEELSRLDVLQPPPEAVQLDRREQLGGGSDAAALAGASAITVTYATPFVPTEVDEWYLDRFDEDWEIFTRGTASDRRTRLIGGLRTDERITVTVEALPPDAAPSTTKDPPNDTSAVVMVTVSKARDT